MNFHIFYNNSQKLKVKRGLKIKWSIVGKLSDQDCETLAHKSLKIDKIIKMSPDGWRQSKKKL